MHDDLPADHRRRGLLLAGAALAGVALPRPLRAALALTPAQTEGPFFPRELPSDRDSDLVRVTGMDTQAVGQVTHVMGRVLDPQGRPLNGVLVEIWQCDANGFYHHPGDRRGRRDPAFQGYGRALTDPSGGYRFRTIRPVAYPGRTPHIHFKVRNAERELLTTQMYVVGEPLNERDFLFQSMNEPERARLLVDLRSAAGIETGALAGTFDIVVPV